MLHCLPICQKISRNVKMRLCIATIILIYCRRGSQSIFSVSEFLVQSLSKIGITDGFASLLWLLISLYELENNKLDETNTTTYDTITKVGSMLRHFNFAVSSLVSKLKFLNLQVNILFITILSVQRYQAVTNTFQLHHGNKRKSFQAMFSTKVDFHQISQQQNPNYLDDYLVNKFFSCPARVVRY